MTGLPFLVGVCNFTLWDVARQGDDFVILTASFLLNLLLRAHMLLRNCAFRLKGVGSHEVTPITGY